MSKVFDLVPYNDPILKLPTNPWNFSEDYQGRNSVQFAEILANTMIEKGGIGLAAPQCGFPVSVFAMGDPSNKESIAVYFNPKIVDFSKEKVYLEEGCLSFPGLYVKIKRSESVRLRFSDVSGKTNTIKFSGISARVVQHEYDHLLGIVHTRKATHYHLAQARKHQRKLLRRARKASVSGDKLASVA
jgi:peptide deformylase